MVIWSQFTRHRHELASVSSFAHSRELLVFGYYGIDLGLVRGLEHAQDTAAVITQ